LNELPSHLPTLEERMAAVIGFSRRNFIEGTGGPFAAGVFERDSGRLVVIGVNCVVPSNCSAAHAEIVALSLAQAMLGTHDLGAAGLPAYQLIASWQPCAMCAAAIAFARIRRLIFAAYDPKSGGVEHGARVFEHPTCHHHPEVVGGVNAAAAERLLRDFFRARR